MIQLSVMTADHEGNTWIGSETGGLFRIHRQSIAVYSTPQGLGWKKYLSSSASQER